MTNDQMIAVAEELILLRMKRNKFQIRFVS